MVRARLTIPVVGALAVVSAATVATVAAMRHARGTARGREVEGGILMGNAGSYDLQTRLLKGSLFKGIAADVARVAADVAPDRARVLDIGCGPGHLVLRLATNPHLEVTGLDLDPAMIERARANAQSSAASLPRGTPPAAASPAAAMTPAFVVGNVGELPFEDDSFDIVVSTMSMHHWSDVPGGLAEIARVLRPNGRALIWDLRPGLVPFHRHGPDAVALAEASPLRLIGTRPWHWPWRFSLLRRMDLEARPALAAT